jgi:hypothetical protein
MFVPRNGAKNCVERAQPDALVVRNHYSLVRRQIGFEDDVAALLMYDPVVKLAHQDINDLATAEIPGSFISP